jgi:hypothetical protein
MMEPENINELKELNALQADQEVLPGGTYGFEKEGFEADDFKDGDEDPEDQWGEPENFGPTQMEGGAGKFK